MRRNTMSRLILLITLAYAAGCAEGKAVNLDPGDESKDTLDVREDIQPDIKDEAPDQDASSDADVTLPLTQWSVCVLNGEASDSEACAEDDALDFGLVYAGQMIAYLVRIDNTGTQPITLADLNITNPKLVAQWVSYSSDDPPVETIEAAPWTLQGGTSGFVQVNLMADLEVVVFENDSVDFSLTSDATQTITIPIRGQLSGCALNTANCDGDLVNGCEIDTGGSLVNCGGCGIPCALDYATEQCTAGVCVLNQCELNFDNCDNQDANGCEVNLKTDTLHCGACDRVCDYINAQEECTNGGCAFLGCETGFADCDSSLENNGCEVDTITDTANCGGCGVVCDRPNANTSCSSSTCAFDGCASNYFDLDGNQANGCEYACTFISADDRPDFIGQDANCDGIDGVVARALFVDGVNGSDAYAGSPALPKKTIQAAIDAASMSGGLDQVYVSAGTYTEQVSLISGVSVYGGFNASAGWTRSNANVTTITFGQVQSERIIAVRGASISIPTTVDGLNIVAPSTNQSGVSVYGLHCEACNLLTLSNNVITAGNGGSGAAGVAGQSGVSRFGSPSIGGNGTQGDDDGSSRGQGGAGGSSPCTRTGGRGGLGGSKGSNAGVTGDTGNYGTAGGAGGAGGDPGQTGLVGSTGSNGSSGTNGTKGLRGSVNGGVWLAGAATSGSIGTHGNGGGGGGGGGGQGCFFCDNGSGNGGGGGGGGGCYGSGGLPGAAGGSSFGLFLFQSTGVILDDNTIESGNGASGGRGGDGGDGSTGAAGGLGRVYRTSEIGKGGNGGRGGTGGRGGHAGGGAGGMSYAVYLAGTNQVILPASNTLAHGSAGSGGTSSWFSSRGENGLSGDFN